MVNWLKSSLGCGDRQVWHTEPAENTQESHTSWGFHTHIFLRQERR